MAKQAEFYTNRFLPPYEKDKQRKEDKKFYNGATWKRVRAGFLREHPLCVDCNTDVDLEVHHILDRRSHPHLQYDWDNLSVLCQKCHLRKRNMWQKVD